VRRTLTAAPRAVRIVCLAALVLAAFLLTNLVYHVVRKPSELLFFVGGALDKEPIETWRRYEPLFHTYSTSTITPELLAALAQVESTGNPVARTYWRWQLTWNPFAVYKPASSAVGMYQMTDAAYAEAARYCIRGNAVVDTDCGFTGLYTRAVPSHAIELAAVYLPQGRRSSCPRARRSGKPAAEAGSRCIHPSLRRRSRLRLRAPWFSDDGRRALRRSSRRGISRQGQCDEAAVSAPCCQRPELA
jgi:hypothetical protein